MDRKGCEDMGARDSGGKKGGKGGKGGGLRAHQSATQNLNVHPARVSLFTFKHFITPCAMCMRPDGSKPSYATIPGFLSRRL